MSAPLKLTAREPSDDREQNVCLVEAMTVMDHTPECDKTRAEERRLREEWERRWPSHCRACHGHGGTFDRYDPSPAGIALSPGYMEDFEPCAECLEVGRCPRCGAACPLVDHDYYDVFTCSCGCGWTDERECADLAPSEWDSDCGCWDLETNEEEVDAILAETATESDRPYGN